MMTIDLTPEEMQAAYSVLYDEYYYGQELMYQDTEEAKAVSRVMEKLNAALIEGRKL